MSRIYLDPSDEGVEVLRQASFPSYRGHTFSVEIISGPIHLENYWSGGSKKDWVFIRLADMTSVSLGLLLSNPLQSDAHQECHIPHGYVAVAHVQFQGKDMGLRFYVHPENIALFLSAPLASLSRNERIVLAATRSLKSSYGGIKDFRFHEAKKYTSISRQEWDDTKISLIEKGMLQKNGSITPAGRNASGRDDITYTFREDVCEL